MTDASRAVGVCSNLLSSTLRDNYVAEHKDRLRKAREQHAEQEAQGARYKLAEARAHGVKTDWENYTPPKPGFIGVQRIQGLLAGRDRRLHRLDAVLQHLGTGRALPENSAG